MNRRVKIFLLLFYSTFICWAVTVLFCETQRHVLFAAGGDLFADFFNSVRYVAGRDPYFDTTIAPSEHIYPPICYLVFYPFACLYKWCGAVTLPDDDVPVFWRSSIAMATCVFFMVISMLPLVWAIWRIVRKKTSPATGLLLLASLFLSGIMMFSFERGNLVVLTASMLAVFMVYNENGRGWGWIPLAISMKIYPVTFIALMMQKHKLREIALVVVSIMALGFLPLLLFKHGMLENSLQLLQNVKVQGMRYYDMCPPNLSMSSYLAAAAKVLNIEWLAFAAKTIRCGTFILGVVSFFGVFVVEAKWKRWFLAAAAATLCSNFAGYYTLLYFVPAIYAYLTCDGQWKKIDWLYMIACIIWLTPFQFSLLPVRNDSINPFISSCMIIVVTMVILLEPLVLRYRGTCGPIIDANETS